MVYDNQMEPECLCICDALNLIPGIATTESCYGHGEYPFRIYFGTSKIRNLFVIARAICNRYHGSLGHWRCELMCTDLEEDPVHFILHSGSTVGERAYAEANKIAVNIINLLKDEKLMKHFGVEGVNNV